MVASVHPPEATLMPKHYFDLDPAYLDLRWAGIAGQGHRSRSKGDQLCFCTMPHEVVDIRAAKAA